MVMISYVIELFGLSGWELTRVLPAHARSSGDMELRQLCSVDHGGTSDDYVVGGGDVIIMSVTGYSTSPLIGSSARTGFQTPRRLSTK